MGRQCNNTIKIDCHAAKRLVSRVEIAQALVAASKDPELPNHIAHIGERERTSVWHVTFASSYDANQLLGKRIRLNDVEILVEDTDEPYAHFTFRIDWLPHNTTQLQVCNSVDRIREISVVF